MLEIFLGTPFTGGRVQRLQESGATSSTLVDRLDQNLGRGLEVWRARWCWADRKR
jgi:hypothetical protein